MRVGLTSILLLGGALISCQLGGSTNSPPTSPPVGTPSKIGVGLTSSKVMTGVSSRGAIGQSDSTGLTSYQVAVSNIRLYSDLDVIGSGFNEKSGAQKIELFNGLSWAPGSTTLPADSDYVDLLSEASMDAFAAKTPEYTLQTTDAGTYPYLTVTFAPYVRFQGQVTISAGGTPKILYSQSGGIFVENTAATPNAAPSTGRGWYTDNSSADFATGPATLATVKLTTGGFLVKFAKPLVLTADDIAAGRTLKLTLAFDPVGAITAAEAVADTGNGGTLMITGNTWDKNLNSFNVTAPNLGALVAPAGSTIVRETYSATIREVHPTTGKDVSNDNTLTNLQWFKEQLQIYSLQSDPETVLSAQFTGLIDPTSHLASDSTSFVPPQPTATPMFFDTTVAGKLTLEDYDHKKLVDGLTRLTTKGATGTADFYYQSQMDPVDGHSTGTLVSTKMPGVIYTLDDIRTITN